MIMHYGARAEETRASSRPSTTALESRLGGAAAKETRPMQQVVRRFDERSVALMEAMATSA